MKIIINKLLILGLITARGGSKVVPQKNIKIVAGKHLIIWTIEAALKTSMLIRVILTTDDKIIAEIGKKNNVEVPFLIPGNLAKDNSSHIAVIHNAVKRPGTGISPMQWDEVLGMTADKDYSFDDEISI